MHTPDFMPVLSKGAHDSPTEGACVMELVSFVAGEEWSDSPACTHPVLARMAQTVNDRLPDNQRHTLVPLIGRLLGTGETGTDHERRVLRVRLAAWCARQVERLVSPNEVREACRTAVDTAEAWCEGRATPLDCETATYAAYAAYTLAAAAANDSAAAYAANAYSAVTAANAAAAAYIYNAADAAANAYSAADDLTQLLVGLIDEHARLTGRVEVEPLTADQWRDLADLTHA